MESWYRIQSGLIAAVICIALAVSVLLRRRSHVLFRRFAWFNLNLAGWFLVDALTLSEVLSLRMGLSARAMIASLLPATCIGFFVGFAAEVTRLTKTVRRFAVVLSVLLVTAVVVGWPVSPVWQQWVIFGGLMTSLLLALGQMGFRLRNLESRVDQTRLKYVIVAGLVVFALLALEFVPGLEASAPSRILTALYMLFLFQVVTRRRILDIFEFAGRFVVMSGFAVVLGLIYVLLVAWWRYDLGLFIFNTAIATIVMLIVFDPLRSLVEERLNQLVFREKFEFTKQAEGLRNAMATVIDVRVLAKLIMDHLERSRRVTHASMYIREEDGLSYRRQGHVGTPPPEGLDAIQARPFLDRLLESQLLAIENLMVERDELRKGGVIEDQARVEVIEAVIANMEECQSSLSIGFISEGQLLGLLSVRDERLREAYASDEIKALVAIAAQATITIDNSRLFDRLRERDRLAALGEMAAGLAHEIRNPLGAIKGAAQLLDEDKADGAEYLQVITEEVNRLNGVVSQFLTYARPFKGTREGIDLNGVLERSVTLVNAEEHPCEVSLETATELPNIHSDAEMLRQVILNLARNAIEAMGEEGGKLRISTSQIQRRSANTMGQQEPMELVRIRFEDEGPGIPPEVLERIFIPFYTTKTGGTGLGLAICQRIIRSLGGSIEVSSRVGEGSTFTILLPVGVEPRTRPATSPAVPGE